MHYTLESLVPHAVQSGPLRGLLLPAVQMAELKTTDPHPEYPRNGIGLGATQAHLPA
ncbi:hypothetical protein ACODT5_06190 [Streptomyces sp. 5.8]|uniref:hypothetical protein n=1 Tax=Streptomyces sp. 5.8 TaxID=3406571 RepID=UPI003BB48D10